MPKDFCKSVITIPQITGTCWFNALMMMIFYSQYSRKLLLYYKPFDGKTDILSKTLKSILYKNYKLDKKTIDFFTKNTINSVLSKFNLEPKINDFISTKGYFIPFFISKLFEGLDVNYLTIDFFNTYSYSLYGKQMKNFYFSVTETVSLYEDNYNNQIFISYLNDYNERQRYKKFIKNKIENVIPLYLIVNLWTKPQYLNNYFGYNTDAILNDFNILNGYFNFNIVGINELLNEITFNGRTYILDSVSLGNYNDEEIRLGHAIAGISCKNDKYVYNGWIRNTNDPAMKTGIDRTLPCELMPFNWDIHRENDFCINKNKCDLNGYLDRYNDLCFSFNKGDRTLIYILKNDEYKSLDYNKSSSISYKIDHKRDKKDKRELNRMKKEIKKEIKEIKLNIDKYKKYKKELNKLIENDNKKIKKLIEDYKKISK